MTLFFKSLSRKLPEEIGIMLWEAGKELQNFSEPFNYFSIVKREIFDSTDPLVLHRTHKTSSFHLCLYLRFSYFNKCFHYRAPPKVSFTSAHPQHVREFLSHVLQHTLHGKDSFLLAPHHLYLNFYLGLRPFINHISKLSVRMKFLSLAIFVGLFLAACVSCSVAAKSASNNNGK